MAIDYRGTTALITGASSGLGVHFARQLAERGPMWFSMPDAYQPVPFMAVYGATKAFVLSFTEALWFEAKGTGLGVVALSPGATRTEFFDVAGAGARIGEFREPSGVVALALSTLDRRNPPPSIIDGGRNRFLAFSGRLVSRRFLATASGRLASKNPV